MTFVAVITGASSGIGEATVRRLHARLPHAEILAVARRSDRVDALAAELNGTDDHGHAHVHGFAADLTDPGQVAALARHVEGAYGHLDLLVNNAGARWSRTFADGGHANVAQTMAINFDAQVRITEAMLGLLRAARAADGGAAPHLSTPAVVNVASTAARVARGGSGAYSASKFALAGWTDSLALELKPEGIHVGLVNPGFIATEGFPATELVSHPVRRHMVGTAERAADAILSAGLDGRAEVYVPGFYRAFALMRTVTPWLIRRMLAGGAYTTQTANDKAADA